MSFMSWGMYPKVKNNIFKFDKKKTLMKIINEHDKLIPCGNVIIYGDSALNSNIVDVRSKNYFIDFNEEIGLLHVQAGVLLSEYWNPLCLEGGF